MNEIRKLREEKELTQKKAAELAGISLRSFIMYESSEDKKGNIRYDHIVRTLQNFNPIDEEHGLLTIEIIRKKCAEVFADYKTDYVYLFGSYAKGKETESSDVDLLVSVDAKGLKFYGLVEKLRETLHKKVDVLNKEQLKNNFDLTNEIMKDGIKIYG